MLSRLKSFIKRRKKISVLMILIFFPLLIWALSQVTPIFKGKVNQLELNLSQPDVLIVSASLSSLPRDIQQIPLLQNVLTEDFVFYYEQHENLLSLKGTLKRLAFENQLQIQDQLLKASLDVPAQIALWNDKKGAPRHAIVLLKRGWLVQLIEQLSKVPATDMQLSVLSKFSIKNQKVTLYALRSSGRQTLALAAHGDTVLIASDIGMLVDAEKNPDAQALSLLDKLFDSPLEQNNVWTDFYHHSAQLPSEVRHSIDVSSRFLGQNYHDFFPDFKALQLNLKGRGKYQLSALLNDQAYSMTSFQTATLWKNLPQSLSWCVSLPVNWQKLHQLVPETQASNFHLTSSLSFEGPAAVCWAEKGQLIAPLFMAQLRSSAAQSATSAQDLAALFAWAIRSHSSGSSQETSSVSAFSPLKRPQILKIARDSFLIQQPTYTLKREYAGDDIVVQASLLKAKNTLAFSFDPRLIDKVAQVNQKNYPSLSDAHKGLGPNSMMWISPSGVAALLLKDSKLYVAQDNQENDLSSRIRVFGQHPNASVELSRPQAVGVKPTASVQESSPRWAWHLLNIQTNP